VGEAYQVLSSEEMRAKYDTTGKEALEASSLVDPTSFFAMLFGSEPFEYLIGELRLATMFLHGGDVDVTTPPQP
jgi:DnaJ-class molecular chaperone